MYFKQTDLDTEINLKNNFSIDRSSPCTDEQFGHLDMFGVIQL